MTDQTHDDYYAMREQQERRAAEGTTDPTARRVHLDLAQRYAAKRDAQIAA